MDDERLLKVEEVARRLAMSRTAVYGLLATGRLASLSLGRSRRVRASDVSAFIRAEVERQSAPPHEVRP